MKQVARSSFSVRNVGDDTDFGLLAMLDNLINGRIGECRIIQLVVSPPSKAVQIDEYVFPEFPLVTKS